MNRWLTSSFGADLRSLALLRVGYALLILIDLAIRLNGLEAHYTDRGVLPRHLFWRLGDPFDTCLHVLGGSIAFIGFLFLLQAGAAVALLVGYKTRWATFASWLFVMSLHERNFALLNGGDTWLRMTLFWAMFLPWGERWSWESTRPPASEQAYSAATFAFFQQVFTVYFLAGLAKYGATWWSEGTAIQLSLMLTEWNGPLSNGLLYYPGLMKVMTFSLLLFEVVGPFLLISPIATEPLRTVAVAIFFSFHFGLFAFMELGMFPWVGMVTVLGLLPGWAWQAGPLKTLQQRLDERFSRWPSVQTEPNRLSRTVQVGLMLLCLYLLTWNVLALTLQPTFPRAARVPGYIFSLDQYWGLFAPDPPAVHGWPVMEGVLESGERVNLFTGAPFSWRPPRSSADYPNQRWKRLLVTTAMEPGAPMRGTLIDYFIERWKRLHPDQSLKIARFYWLTQHSLVNFEETPPAKKLLYERELP